MAGVDFEKTPEEKAAHVAAQFGTGSLYAKVWRVIADLASETDLETAVKGGEIFAGFKLNQRAVKTKREIEARNQS